ncbi:MAG: Trp family transcriptional regulator [Patescibacteria group bacterium]
MVNISKRPVDEKKLFKLYQLFFEVVNNVEDKDEFLELIQDILSPVEQIMIAKRIAIIYLLTKRVEQIDIAENIKVSRATVGKFNLLFYKKKTRLIKTIESFLKNEKIGHFFEDLFADVFIHPGIYIGHHKLKWEHEKRKEERKMIDV